MENSAESQFQVVAYVTRFGVGVIREVLKENLSEKAAQAYLASKDPNLSSEDWVVEEQDVEDATSH